MVDGQSKDERRLRKPFEFVAIEDWKCEPAAFVIDQLVEADTLGLIFGEPGHGKSFVAVEMAVCVATGAPFFGHSVKPGPVLYIAGEGHSNLAKRFRASCSAKGVSLDGVYVSKAPAQLCEPSGLQEVIEAAESVKNDRGSVSLIIIDTLSRNFGGSDENSTADMSRFVSALDGLRAHFPGCVVLVVHHPGHGDKSRARGSTVLKAALDFEYCVSKKGETICFKNTKMKDAEAPSPMAFKLVPFTLDNAINSAVLEVSEGGLSAKPLTSSGKVAKEAFVNAAAKLCVPCDGNSVSVFEKDWRSEFNEMQKAKRDDAKAKAFLRARSELAGAGLIQKSNDDWICIDQSMITDISARKHNRTYGTSSDNV